MLVAQYRIYIRSHIGGVSWQFQIILLLVFVAVTVQARHYGAQYRRCGGVDFRAFAEYELPAVAFAADQHAGVFMAML